MTATHETDAVIVGAGPVGLFAVFELGLLDIRAHLVDVLDRPGGQCAELYPEKPIYDIPALPVVSGQELTDRLMTQIRPFSPVFHFGQTATGIARTEKGFRVTTDAGTVIDAKTVIIAAGGGSFTPKKPPVKGLEDFEGTCVFYAVRDREMFRNRNVVVAGGGDSALDWALDLQPLAASLTLLHRRAEFRAAPHSVARLRALAAEGKIALETGNLAELSGTAGRLSSIALSRADGTRKDILCDMLLAFYGLTMKSGPLEKLCAAAGVEMKDGLIPADTEKFGTNIPGIFAIGDINVYPGKLKLILSGFHEAALMARAAFAHVHPGRKWRFEYTTSSSGLQEKLGVRAS